MEESKEKFIFPVDWSTLLSKEVVIIILLGLIFLGFGTLLFKSEVFFRDNAKIEILDDATNDQNNNKEVVVEIAGSVEKPAVYKLPQGSRVDDLLIASGGLSVDADRKWVEKTINRASLLKDGQKIYIPSREEVKNNINVKTDQSVLGLEKNDNLLNINSASLQELDKLPGIGPVYGQRIIDQKPYSSIDELIKRDIIPQKTYDKIKDLITAR